MMENSEKDEKAIKELLETARKEKQATLINALYKGLYELDEASRANILRKVGAACAQSTRALRKKMGVEYPTGVDLDTCCEAYTRIVCDGPLKRDFTFKKDGDTVEIRDAIADVFGHCACTMVTAGFTEPNESLCRYCQEGFWIDTFEYMTGRRPERSEFPESYCMGHRDCVALCHFKPTE